MLRADMSVWYYGRADQQHGPVDEQVLRGKIASGEVPGDWLVWREGMNEWQPVVKVPELQGGTTGAGIYAAPGTAGVAGPAVAGPVLYYPPTNGLAIASMICGIVSVLMLLCYLGALTGIPAVICGHMALKRIAESPVPQAGRGMAIAGLVTGYIGIATSVMLVGVMVFALMSAN